MAGAERFRRDPELKQALLTLARHDHSRECLLLLEAILETPGLMPRLTEVLRPKIRAQGSGIRDQWPEQGAAEPQMKSGQGRGKKEAGAKMNWERFIWFAFLRACF